MERAVVGARSRAWTETYRRLADQLTAQRREALDGLLVTVPELGMSPLAWLRRMPPGRPAGQIRALLGNLDRWVGAGGRSFDVSMLNPNRVRHLAGLARRMDTQALARMQPERRYPILVAAVTEGMAATSDLVLDLFDTALGAIDRSARRDIEAMAKTNADTANEAVTVFGQVARVMLDPAVPDHLVRSTVWHLVGRDRFAETAQRAAAIQRPVRGGHLGLVVGQCAKARRFAPGVLAAFEFGSSTSDDPLRRAIGVLKELYASGGRVVPDDAPTGFVPSQWRPHVWGDDGRIERHGWEMCVLTQLRGALRGANLWIDHGRRYQDPARYLMSDLDWERLRADQPTETGISLDPSGAIQRLDDLLNQHLAAVDDALATGEQVRIDDERLVVTPLPAEADDPDLEQLRADIAGLLPHVDLIDLLVEVNSWCGFVDEACNISSI